MVGSSTMSNNAHDLSRIPSGSRSLESRPSTSTDEISNIHGISARPIDPGAPEIPDGKTDEDAAERASPRQPIPPARRPLIVVPRAKRRGLLAQLTIIPEVERPYDYSNSVKWTLTSFVAMAACAAPMGSAIFYPALPEISEELGISPTIANLSVAFYMLSMSIFPLWWSSFSERLGRRNIYLVSFLLNVIFTILSGFSVNAAMLIVMRVFAGGAAASVQAVGAGSIADIWQPRERGRAMGVFYLGPLMGPLLAPILGGALTAGFGWESTMFCLAAYGAVVFLLVLFAVPETLHRKDGPATAPENAVTTSAADPEKSQQPQADLSRVASRRSVTAEKSRRAATWLKTCLVDPLEIITYLRFPAIALTVYYAAITFGSLYVLNISVQSAFSVPPYSFSPIIIGLLYIPSSLGYFMASVFGGAWIDRIMHRAAIKANRFEADGTPKYLPEDRMRENAWISATLYPASLIWYGWAVQYGTHWIVPAVANFFFGVGSMLVFSAATTMLTEFMPGRSSNGVALNNFVRNIFSCTGGVVAQPLINVMGHGWLLTMLALIAWTTGNVCIWFLRKNAQRWRVGMDRVLNGK
ncbi:major facilitator superfamily transporter multidrug resistance [Xylariomycetidae sp. FL2044]|nr:major facilitator superfamily transporter multidrug resistance [Xylariomycetidae sp. FL2044]